MNISKTDTISVSSYRVIPGLPEKEKEDIIFYPIYKDWTKKSLAWWEKQGVFDYQLDRINTLTKPVKGYIQIKKGRKSEINFNETCYCYHHNNDKVKFYFPERKTWRFLGNMTKSDLWMIQKSGDTLVITKSHKDVMALESCVPYSITHVQAEASYPPSEIIFEWEIGYDNIIILFDNDQPGRKGAKLLADQFLYKKPKIVFLEDHKDVSAMIKAEGLRETTDYLHEIL